MSENILSKQILDAFFLGIETNADFPAEIRNKLNELRQTDKLAKSNHLKNLFSQFSLEEQSNNADSTPRG